MITSLFIKIWHDIEDEVELPSGNYFYRNETSVRMVYRYRSTRIRYIHLKTRREVAVFLKENRMIHHFEEVGETDAKMFVENYDINLDEQGVPHMKTTFIEFPWKDVEFTRGQVLTFAAQKEWDKNKKLRKLFRDIFKLHKAA